MCDLCTSGRVSPLKSNNASIMTGQGTKKFISIQSFGRKLSGEGFYGEIERFLNVERCAFFGRTDLFESAANAGEK